ncbi:MAG: Tetrahydromethanopterin S-methyltransferase subunit G [Candidatus Methanocomedens sp.]|nr:MAG: Tetrahydromethanopterin S-methyltransferase subunit G [ANME-2 cluster archaeon]
MAENKVPEIIVDATDYQEIIKKLNLIDEKIEFTNSEMQQRVGKRLGRDIGILYGISIGLILVVMYLLIVTTLGLTPATTVQLQEGESLLSAVIRILL